MTFPTSYRGYHGAWSTVVVIHGVQWSRGHFSACSVRVFFPNFCFSSILFGGGGGGVAGSVPQPNWNGLGFNLPLIGL